MRAALVVSLAAFWGATCQRVEEPVPSTEARPGTTRGSEKARAPEPSPPPPEAAASAAGPCVVPLEEPAPAPARATDACPKDPVAAPPTLPIGSVAFPDAPSRPVLEVELARTSETVQRGLMFRKALGAKRGMLFVFDDVRPRTFWMKNTCIPLDMLFLASDGTIAGILEQVPVLNEAPRSVPCPAAYVLEVNAGYARRHGVKPGMKVELKL